jgi:hypothetical protein
MTGWMLAYLFVGTGLWLLLIGNVVKNNTLTPAVVVICSFMFIAAWPAFIIHGAYTAGRW